ncbi:MAG: hypothetical protein ACK5LC_12210 [Coprobacillaceae bacterium]
MELKDLLKNDYKKGMTIAQVNTLLKNKDFIERNDLQDYVKKITFDKVASECASWKRKYRSLKSKNQENLKELVLKEEEYQKQYQELQRQLLVITYENQYILMGYDEVMAKESSIALYDGDITTVLKNQQKFVQKVRK